MKTSTVRLLDTIEENPTRWVVPRSEENYDAFLNLYLELSYPNIHPSQLSGWRSRSVSSWKLQDKLIPTNCIGGGDAKALVSAFGALPICRKLIYAHSLVMRRSLKGAATAFAATFCTFDLMRKLTDIEYWMGIYTYKSRFVTSWQRPSSFNIPDQIELEEIRVYPLRVGSQTARNRVRLVPAASDDFNDLSDVHQNFARMMMDTPEVFRGLYTLQAFSARDENDSQVAVALLGDAPDEFNALNIFRWAFIVPNRHDIAVDSTIADDLRSCDLLKDRVLRILTNGKLNPESWTIRDCDLVPAFIALTPRSQLHLLRDSLRLAFAPILEKYSDGEISSLISESLAGAAA